MAAELGHRHRVVVIAAGLVGESSAGAVEHDALLRVVEREGDEVERRDRPDAVGEQVAVEAFVGEVRARAERDRDRSAVAARVRVSAQHRQNVAAVDERTPNHRIGLAAARREDERARTHDAGSALALDGQREPVAVALDLDHLAPDEHAAARCLDAPSHGRDQERQVELPAAAVQVRLFVRQRRRKRREPGGYVRVVLDDEMPVPLELAGILAPETVEVIRGPDVAAGDRRRAADRRRPLHHEHRRAVLRGGGRGSHPGETRPDDNRVDVLARHETGSNGSDVVRDA